MGGKGQAEEYIYTEDQLQKLFGACRDTTDKAVVGMLGYMGLRVGEVVHLKPKWIRDESINIPPRQDCNCFECSGRGYWTPKSKAGSRVLAIPGFLKPAIYEFTQEYPEGINMTRQGIWHRVQRLVQKAKCPPGHCHSLRATAATILASRGFTSVELCQYMGWARISMAESYVRLAEARKSTAKKIKEIYG
ncbi:MAG: putative prophage phiRv2 integrase [Firmicutes bacterium]|nr:putative prophage phiRv2 integrase [Bacillota bacterium]